MNLLFAYLITWNVGNPSAEKVLRALLDMVAKYNPVAFALQEVADRQQVLKEFCESTGYQLVQIKVGQHSASTAVLLRADVPLETGEWFLMSPKTKVGKKVAGSKRTGWTKPKGTTWVRTNFWGRNWVIASTHLTPSHHVLAARVLARIQVAALAVWMRTRARIVLLGGDFNETVDHKFGTLAPLKALATAFTAPSFGKRAIDQWWVVMKKIKKAKISIEVEALPGYPSDHEPVMIKMTKEDVPETHACPICTAVHSAPTV